MLARSSARRLDSGGVRAAAPSPDLPALRIFPRGIRRANMPLPLQRRRPYHAAETVSAGLQDLGGTIAVDDGHGDTGQEDESRPQADDLADLQLVPPT